MRPGSCRCAPPRLGRRSALWRPALGVLLGAGGWAAEAPEIPSTAADRHPPINNPWQTAPTTPVTIATDSQVVVHGLIDVDVLREDNYSDGNHARSDHRGFGLLRAELGATVRIDERVTATIAVGSYGELGESGAPAAPSPTTFPGDLQPPQRRGHGDGELDQAFIQYSDFFNADDLGVDAGRMPVRWSLRRDHQDAFLYDSAAEDRAVAGWDGARAAYTIDDVALRPFTYRLPDASSLYGAFIDWQPVLSDNDRLFLTGSLTLERNVVLRPVASNPTPGLGSRLITYYLGGDLALGAIEGTAEYAIQRGSTASGQRFAGWGGELGLSWSTLRRNGGSVQVALRGDYLSGDAAPAGGTRTTAFINNWSGVSDTYIVESAKYGQLAHYLQGDLEDLKLSVAIGLDGEDRLRLSAVYAAFRMPRPLPGTSPGFGQEGDLTVAWRMTQVADLSLFAGIFKPAAGFAAVAPAGPAFSARDPVSLLGLALAILY